MGKRTLIYACTALSLCISFVAAVGAAEPGQRVKTFGHNGWLVAEGMNGSSINDFVVQSNGKSLAVLDRNNVFHVMRLTRNGTFDPKFNFSGTVTTEFANEVSGEAIAVQKDGKIVVAGGSLLDNAMVVARYLPDGRLDKTFSGNGKLTLTMEQPQQFPVWAYEVSVQANKKIVLAGTAKAGSGQYDLVVTRLRPGGGLDTGYGDNGWRLMDLGGDTWPQDLVLHQGDAWVVGYNEGLDFDMAVARLNGDGDPHPDFGPGYKVIDTGATETALSAAIAKNGNLLIGGDRGGASDRDMMVARITQEGFLDSGFAGGVGYETVPGAGGARGIAVQRDGKVVLSGSGHTGTKNEMFLVRFRPRGLPDGSFDDDGILIASPKDGIVAPRLGIDGDNQIIVGGWRPYSLHTDFIFGRFHTGLPKN